MAKKEDIRNVFYQEEEKRQSISKKNVINTEIFDVKRTAPFSIAVDKAMNDNKQLVLDMDEESNKFIQSALVKYDTKKNITFIWFKNFFKDMSKEEFEEIKMSSILPRDSGPYNIFARKVKHIFEAKLFEVYDNYGNIPLQIKDSELAELMNKPQSYISANITNILNSLLNIQITFREKYQPKNKNQDNFTKVHLVEAIKHEKGVSYLLFGQVYANYLAKWGFTQYPKALLKTNDKQYQLAFDIGSYICEMRYQNRNVVKIKSIYNRVTSIRRYEDVRDNGNRAYQKLIYKPFDENIQYLNSLSLFNIEYENSDFLNSKNETDFEKWLDTNMIITWYADSEPNYERLEEGREENRKKAEKEKKKRSKKK